MDIEKYIAVLPERISWLARSIDPEERPRFGGKKIFVHLFTDGGTGESYRGRGDTVLEAWEAALVEMNR